MLIPEMHPLSSRSPARSRTLKHHLCHVSTICPRNFELSSAFSMLRRLWNRIATPRAALLQRLSKAPEQNLVPKAGPLPRKHGYAFTATAKRESSNVRFSRVAPFALQPRVIIYDGVCHLCNAGVRWVIRVDKSESISFCAVQSEAADAYLIACGVSRDEVLQRFIFVEGPGYYYSGSTAALKVASYLPLPYSALSVFLVIPTPIRDAVYDYIAKRRYRWFGRSGECIVPSEQVLHRFIDKDELLELKERQESEGDDNQQVG